MDPREEGFRDEPLFMSEESTPSERSSDSDDSFAWLRTSSRYLKDLPRVQLNGLPEDERACGICQETYAEHEMSDTVVKLVPCGHMFGYACVYEWLAPFNRPNKNTCPMCREVLFELDHSGWSDSEEEDEEAEDDRVFQQFISGILDQIENDTLEAAITATMGFIQDFHRLPQELYFSNQVLILFRRFRELPIFSTDVQDRQDENAEDSQGPVQDMATLMGCLYTKLEAIVRFFEGAVPWGRGGPPLSFLYRRESHGLLEVALLRLLHYETLHRQRDPWRH